jgi:hypothetical protein
MSGKDDEVAAMAAMFQAQSANWEETQEKMSQLVSPLAVLPVSSSNFSNTHFFRCPFFIAGRFAFFSPFSLSQSDSGLHQSTWNGFGRSRRQAVYPTPPTGRSAAPA